MKTMMTLIASQILSAGAMAQVHSENALFAKQEITLVQSCDYTTYTHAGSDVYETTRVSLRKEGYEYSLAVYFTVNGGAEQVNIHRLLTEMGHTGLNGDGSEFITLQTDGSTFDANSTDSAVFSREGGTSPTIFFGYRGIGYDIGECEDVAFDVIPMIFAP